MPWYNNYSYKSKIHKMIDEAAGHNCDIIMTRTICKDSKIAKSNARYSDIIESLLHKTYNEIYLFRLK